MRTFPQGFKFIVDIILRSKDISSAYTGVNGLNIDRNITEQFHKIYGGDSIDELRSFAKLYRDVKKGQYILEGELQRIKELIREELLHETIDDYRASLENYDFYSSMSDDRRVRQIGMSVENNIKNIYRQLSDEDKLTAAIFYRNFIIDKGIYKNTKMSDIIRNWNPESGDINNFDGISYRG